MFRAADASAEDATGVVGEAGAGLAGEGRDRVLEGGIGQAPTMPLSTVTTSGASAARA